MNSEEREKEIQGALSDLGDVLKGLTQDAEQTVMPQAPPPPPTQQAPVPVEPVPQSSSEVSGAVPSATDMAEESVPEDVPRQQIRRFLFLCSAQQKSRCMEFSQFLTQVTLQLSKNPLYIQRALLLEVGSGTTPAMILERAKAAEVVGVLGILEGLKDSQIREIENFFSREKFFLRIVSPEVALKRTFAVDLIVDIMLLKPS